MLELSPPTNWLRVDVGAAINSEEHRAGLRVMRGANKNFTAAVLKAAKLYSDVAFCRSGSCELGSEHI